ncbi:transporter substrate-binding domain-containing protein [uncultured Microbacterium sp.]|uniref:transporter substrate-binding domain-containing protein n=1 Tax=uncultured Microbacterium sp. TaxID=191216 RepID=UPI0028EB8F88|nr:transporter substrate-binding domain-containing protein [uncultured Microbacterium sp.]
MTEQGVLWRRAVRAGAGILVALALTGCGVAIPADPDGTLETVRSSGVLRAGASPSDDVLRLEDGEPSGPLADLVEGFARQQGASVEWTVGSEETLVDQLEQGELDLVAGGMTDATPWVDLVSVTRGYSGIDGADGRSLVFLLPLGENALQSALEAYLDREVAP